MIAPATLEATGLTPTLVVDLLLRHLWRSAELALADLSAQVALSVTLLDRLLAQMRDEKLVEVPGRGSFDGDVRYRLTDQGRQRAGEAMRRNQYVGAAPVSLTDYVSCVLSQKLQDAAVSRERLEPALRDLVLPPGLLDRLGAALNSHRPLFLYGHSGTGKTFLAEHLLEVIGGTVWVPHAIEIDGEIVQVFDPMVHRRIAAPVSEGSLDRLAVPDARWVACRRPVVKLGGELTLAMLDLALDPVTRYYKAPAQLKANNGLLMLDDLGRQRDPAQLLLNRWIVPLDRRIDYLALHTGQSFEVPFDVMVIFSSNLSPASLDDPAFVRRLGYKIRLDALDEAGYRRVFRQACARAGVAHDEAAADYLIRVLHAGTATPMLPAYPIDLVLKIRDRAVFRTEPARLTPESLRWAWTLYFGAEAAPEAIGSERSRAGAALAEETP